MFLPWFVWRFFIWADVDRRYQWFRTHLRKRFHKAKIGTDGYCERCD